MLCVYIASADEVLQLRQKYTTLIEVYKNIC
jgi:hypothetical protein